MKTTFVEGPHFLEGKMGFRDVIWDNKLTAETETLLRTQSLTPSPTAFPLGGTSHCSRHTGQVVAKRASQRATQVVFLFTRHQLFFFCIEKNFSCGDRHNSWITPQVSVIKMPFLWCQRIKGVHVSCSWLIILKALKYDGGDAKSDFHVDATSQNVPIHASFGTKVYHWRNVFSFILFFWSGGMYFLWSCSTL